MTFSQYVPRDKVSISSGIIETHEASHHRSYSSGRRILGAWIWSPWQTQTHSRRALLVIDTIRESFPHPVGPSDEPFKQTAKVLTCKSRMYKVTDLYHDDRTQKSYCHPCHSTSIEIPEASTCKTSSGRLHIHFRTCSSYTPPLPRQRAPSLYLPQGTSR